LNQPGIRAKPIVGRSAHLPGLDTVIIFSKEDWFIILIGTACKTKMDSDHKCDRDWRSEHLDKLGNRWESRTPAKPRQSPTKTNTKAYLSSSQSKINSWDMRRYSTEGSADLRASQSGYNLNISDQNLRLITRGLNTRGMHPMITDDANDTSENLEYESEIQTPQLRRNYHNDTQESSVAEPQSPNNLFKAKQQSQQLSQNPNYIKYNYDLGPDPFQKIFKGQLTMDAMQEDHPGRFTRVNTFEQFSPLRRGFTGADPEKGPKPNLIQLTPQKATGSAGKWDVNRTSMGGRDPADWMRNSITKEGYQSLADEKLGANLLKGFKKNLVPCPHCDRHFQVGKFHFF
jgi:hypothetical protein